MILHLYFSIQCFLIFGCWNFLLDSDDRMPVGLFTSHPLHPYSREKSTEVVAQENPSRYHSKRMIINPK